jgi:hypothetical protein
MSEVVPVRVTRPEDRHVRAVARAACCTTSMHQTSTSLCAKSRALKGK